MVVVKFLDAMGYWECYVREVACKRFMLAKD